MVIVYYPPGQSVENGIEIINYLTDGLDSLLHVRLSTGIIIAGDFNKLNLSRLCNRFGLKKTVSSPTRGKNSLDQILTNTDGYPLLSGPTSTTFRSIRPSMSILLNPKTTNKIPFVSKSIRLYKPENLHVLSRKVALQNWDTDTKSILSRWQEQI